MTTGADVNREARARRRLRGGAVGIIVLLAVVNLAGTALNLYVTLPDPGGYNGVFPALFGSAAGVAHFLVAVGLFIALLGMIVSARRSGDSRFVWISLVALAAFLVAAYSGYHFVYSGEDGYSFSMEVGFLAVVLSEVAILLRLGRHAPTVPVDPARAAAPSPP